MFGRIGRFLGLSVCLAAVWSLTGAGCLTTPGTGGGVIGTGTLTNLPPVAVITSSLITGISPVTIDFNSDRSTDDGVIVSRSWDFGDGATSLEIAPTHTFSSTGTFTVTLTLTDDGGAVSATTVDIIVTEAPLAIITADRTSAPTAPATINFSAAASFDPDGEIEEIDWDFGDGASESDEDVSHTFATSGTFRVRLTVTDDVGISDTDELLISVGIADPQLELRIPPASVKNIVVPQDGTIWIQGVYNVEEGVARNVRAGVDEDLDPFNNNDVQLDTASPNGNDLNIEAIAGLQLSDVAALNRQSVPVGAYRLWAEVDTDRSDPVRTYSDARVNVVEAFSDAINTNTPVIPLVEDAASVIVNPDAPRQIFDLGPFAAGDRLFLSLLEPPNFKGIFDPSGPYSLMILDQNREIISWYQRTPTENFVLFTEETRLIVPAATTRLFVIMDGGFGVNVRIQRGTNLNQPNPQRVLLDFAGSGNQLVGIGGNPARTIASLDDTLTAFSEGELQTIKDACLARVQALYAPYDVEIVTSDQVESDPNLALELPFSRIYIGGTAGFGAYGLADYLDSRNETTSGTGVVYAATVATDAGGSPSNIGLALGNVAAHELGHLIGLRHTDAVGDLMAMGGVNAPDDATLDFGVNPVSENEQFDNLPVIGIQNAPAILEATIGN